MITTRASAIRFGSVYSWPVKSAELGFFFSNFDLKLRTFFSNFFSQPIVLGTGVGLSGLLLHRFSDRVVIEVFLQDSRLLDWISTKPGFRLQKVRPAKMLVRSSLKKRFAFSSRTFFKARSAIALSAFFRRYKTFTSARRYSLRRKLRTVYKLRYFRRRRRHTRAKRQAKLSRYFSLRRFASNLPRYNKSRFVLQPKKKRAISRRPNDRLRAGRNRFGKFRPRLQRVRSFFRPNFRFGPRFYYSFPKFVRFRFFLFFGRFASMLSFLQLGCPVVFRLHFIGRLASVDFYLNYITTKLYYRYILNDVINPIVRISLKHYRGFRIVCRGRFTRAQIATERVYRRGALSLANAVSPVVYGQRSVVLKYGTCNLKIWLRA